MPLWLIPIIFTAMFVQGLSGFGSALIAMPFLVIALGFDNASAMFAIVSLPIVMVIWFHYRSDFHLPDVLPLMISTTIGIPIGVTVIRAFPEDSIKLLLGVLIIAYSAYALIGPPIPELKSRVWPYIFGFVAGLLGGAYNTGGPPFVIYGTSKRWPRGRFKGNVQAAMLVNRIFVVIAHFLAGRVTGEVVEYSALGLVVMGSGMLLGLYMDRFINPAIFRRIVLALLFVIGLSLVF